VIESDWFFDNWPTLRLTHGDADAFYTLVLVNPSVTVENIGPIVHHMVGNIKGSDFMDDGLYNEDYRSLNWSNGAYVVLPF
jgi:hypothetical protein